MAKHLSITGKVQGVGYRAWFAAQAQALQLSGWVRNRHDGSVEALVIGDARAIDDMLDRARRGPPSARVGQVLVQDSEPILGDQSGFRMLPTT